MSLILVDGLKDRPGTGGPKFPNGLHLPAGIGITGDGHINMAGVCTFSGNVTIGGTLTYEDVTNIDSVGVVTARSGVNVSGGEFKVGTAITVGSAGVSTFSGNVNLNGVSSFAGGVGIADSIFHLGDTDTLVRFPTANEISVETAGSEQLRVTNTGRLLIGTNASRQTRVSNSSFSGLVQVESDAELGFSLSRFVNTDGGPRLILQKARGTAASPAIVQEDDLCGQLLFSGWDGDNFSNLAKINVDVDGTPGDDDMPGRIIFYTTPDGSNSATERLRINSTGQIELRKNNNCLLYTSPSPRDATLSRMPSCS